MANSATTYIFTCAQCGSPAGRPYRGSGVKPTLCSNACKVAAYRARNPSAVAASRTRELERQRFIDSCRPRVVTIRNKPAPKPKAIPPAVMAICMVCGVTYQKRKWDHGHCSIECRAKGRKAASREWQRQSGAKAASRKARKLKQRGVTVEQVNPLKVLRRDGWRCQLCGISTPERLRGTYDVRAPEVDHIIPLSKGGEHSYRNTQCACRKCNLAKSDTIKGQMLLFG